MCGVWPNLVVIALPGCQHGSGLPQRGEQRLIQALVAQPPDEALRERVLLRLARCDVVPANLALLAPCQDRDAGQLGAVVADTQQRARTTVCDDRGQLASNPCAGQRRIGNQAEALAGEVIDHHENAEPPTIGQRVRGEVQ
jgi:hypothetical protein